MASRFSSFVRFAGRFLPAACFFGLGSLVFGQSPNVLTYHNDNQRTGQYLVEKILAPSNVSSRTFGKLFTVPMDGKVDGEPLYVAGLAIPGKGTHNVVFAVTEHDSVYAFDADTGALYWRQSMLGTAEVPSDARNCDQVVPEIGITSTPVINTSAGPSGTIYLVAMSKDGSGKYHQRLHALDLATGLDHRYSAPREISASYPGSGDNSIGGNVVFDPAQYKDRAGLLLSKNIVYTSWASHCDQRLYTGWLMAFNGTYLYPQGLFNFAPNGNEAAVWGAGGGPAVDAAGNLFVSVANGTFDTTLNAQGFPNQGDYGNAFVKLSVAPSTGNLSVADYWTMDNTTSESGNDVDLGSGGIMLLPDVTDAQGKIRHLGVGAGKDGNLYAVDRDNMGKFDSVNNGTLYQELPNALPGGIWSMPAYYAGYVYFGAQGGPIRAFKLKQALLSPTATSSTRNTFIYPGATPSISANGGSNGILWAVENTNPAVLHAYDPFDLNVEYYNSNQAAFGRDQFGNGNKYVAPMIANGKVYLGMQNSVAVFGILPR